jgi:hypothetical protein
VIHCTMEDLVGFRDGEGSAWSKRHLGECPLCQKELEALHQRVAQLRALPTLNPPRDRWPAIRAQAVAARRKKRLVRTGWASLALAASLAGMITVRGVRSHQAGAAEKQDLKSLVSRSQQLEEALRAYDPSSRVMTAATAGAVADLEDRIAAVDAELGDQPRLSRNDARGLWRQRVQLMEGLVSVHAAKATYSGM